MRKLPLMAAAVMFIATQAAVAAPLPTATGPQLRGMDETPIISVKKKKRQKKSSASSGESMSSQPGNPNAPATRPTQGGATQGSGSMGGGGGMGGAPTTGTSR